MLWVIDGLWVGGAERSLAELLPHLVEAGVAPIVAVLRRCGEGVEREILERGFDVRFLPEAGWLTRISALRRLIREERPDILHTSLFKANLAGRLAAVGLPVKVVSSLVNVSYGPVRRVVETHLVPWRVAVVRWIDAWTSRWLTDHFHAVSRAARDTAIANLGLAAERITVVERGRDPERLGRPSAERRGRARAALGIDADAQLVVNVGSQDPQKGQRYLLEAFARLRAERPQLLLWIAGRPGRASRELAELLTSLELEPTARLLGHRDDVPEILAAADVFAFPSLFEGLPGAVIEAMALGLPVVAGRIPPVLEVVEEGRSALLVDPASPTELAEAIGQVLDDPVFGQRLGSRGREIFEERFTVERSARRMVELYGELADG